MATKKTKPEIEMIDARIEPVASQYSDSIASVRATLVFATIGSATARDERRALAYAHRIAADLIESIDRLPTTRGYTAPQVDVRGSYRDRVEVAVTYELVTGERTEADEVVALLHDIVPAPGA